jgi:hypothetical protein
LLYCVVTTPMAATSRRSVPGLPAGTVRVRVFEVAVGLPLKLPQFALAVIGAIVRRAAARAAALRQP